MKYVLTALMISIASPAFASPIKITEGKPTQYRSVQIEAKKVRGVEVQLKKEVTRTDCNEITLNAEAVRVDGNDINWWASFFVTTSMMKTEMYCPTQPKKEIVTSPKMVFESYSNENLDREVNIILIVPAGFEVVATELK